MDNTDAELSPEHMGIVQEAVRRAVDLTGAATEADQRFLARLALQAFRMGVMEPEHIAGHAVRRYSENRVQADYLSPLKSAN